MRFLIAAVAAWSVAILGHADDILFESATLGPTGITVDQGVPASNIGVFNFSGARFELTQPVVTTSVGGHFRSSGAGGDFFGAIVAFDGPDDLPDSEDLSTPDVLGFTLLDFPNPSADVYGDLELSLEPGWYGVVFGSGLFGATGGGAVLRNNTGFPDVEVIARLTGPWGELTPAGTLMRFVVTGRVVPEPQSLALAIIVVTPSLLRIRSDIAR